MPGRLFLTEGQVVFEGHQTPALSPRRNISPGERLWALTRDGFQEMRWGMIPSGRKNARGRPVMETIINARSETVFDKSAFDGVGRAVVPATGWYEWTGPKGRKDIWEITSANKEVLWFAAITDIWHAPNGQDVFQLATVTCPPNLDLRDIHDRMGCVLTSDDVQVWLTGDVQTARAVLRSAPDGSLCARKVSPSVLES